MTMVFNEVAVIPHKGTKSLLWSGDSLVDWVNGGVRMYLDGGITQRTVNYSYRFDAACGSPSGEYVVIYERLGTKALVLRNGKVLREINRSYYHAHDYEFPITIARLPSGREVLVHCPERYNQIEIDDISTGVRLTSNGSRAPCDFFHSRFLVNPAGTIFLSAGWIWHPLDILGVYRLNDALSDAASLDGYGMLDFWKYEVTAAAFIDDHHIIAATCDESLDETSSSPTDATHHYSLAIWDVKATKLLSQTGVSDLVGTMMPVGSDFVVGFFEYPRLWEIATGNLSASLPHLGTGKQASSIISREARLPPLALDRVHNRFAVSTDKGIHVVEVQLAK